jgi:predicted HAD superfamily Cof-like phosphohydrolase
MSLKTKSFLSENAQEFRTAFQVANSQSPKARRTQLTLIVEEFKEFLDAERQVIPDLKRNEADALKELGDLVYVCYQYATNMGWDLDEAMKRIHRSNMSKLDDNGQPIYRHDGKVLKGPNYKEPNLTDIV